MTRAKMRPTLVVRITTETQGFIVILSPCPMSHHLPPNATPPYMYPPDHPYWFTLPPFQYYQNPTNDAYPQHSNKSIWRYGCFNTSASAPTQALYGPLRRIEDTPPPPIPPRPPTSQSIEPPTSYSIDNSHPNLSGKPEETTPGRTVAPESPQDKHEDVELAELEDEDELLIEDLQAERDEDWPKIGTFI
ncbi:hypothetical protein DFH28DRAFT_923286 [Melampsora americana]|nr:hypothetical protein DFH28DRAFT_923286 [Melampsora americana]